MRLDRESEHWYRAHKGLAGWKKESVRDHPYSVTFVGASRRNTTTVLRLDSSAEYTAKGVWEDATCGAGFGGLSS